MTVASNRVCVTLNLSGEVTHWLRYSTIAKSWSAACHGPVSDYEDTHRTFRAARGLKMKCQGCWERMFDEITNCDERNKLWEILFHDCKKRGLDNG